MEGTTDTHIKYCKEINRLESFANYQSTDCNFTDEIKKDFARAGLYSTGEDEIIKCNFCHFHLTRLLEDEEDPIELHNRFNSGCPFICREPTNNIPIDANLLSTKLPERDKFIVGTHLPEYPQYSTADSRLNSFRGWSPKSCMRVNDLVAAGFFYLGDGDQVGCFQCGLSLKNFTPNEIPLETHKKFRGECLFLKSLADPKTVASRNVAPIPKKSGCSVKCSIIIGTTVVLGLWVAYKLNGSSLIPKFCKWIK